MGPKINLKDDHVEVMIDLVREIPASTTPKTQITKTPSTPSFCAVQQRMPSVSVRTWVPHRTHDCMPANLGVDVDADVHMDTSLYAYDVYNPRFIH